MGLKVIFFPEAKRRPATSHTGQSWASTQVCRSSSRIFPAQDTSLGGHLSPLIPGRPIRLPLGEPAQKPTPQAPQRSPQHTGSTLLFCCLSEKLRQSFLHDTPPSPRALEQMKSYPQGQGTAQLTLPKHELNNFRAGLSNTPCHEATPV